MRLFSYINNRTGLVLEGIPSRQGDSLTFKALPLPDVQAGDLLTLPHGRQVIVVSVDQTALDLPRPRLRHVKARVVPVTGLVSISRSVPSANDFGRSVCTLEEVISDAPASLTDSREVVAEGSPVGPELLILRHVLLVRSDTALQPRDLVTYSASGALLDLKVIGGFPLSSSLWQLHCTDA